MERLQADALSRAEKLDPEVKVAAARCSVTWRGSGTTSRQQ